jgi:predicted acyl esterase
VRHGGIASIAFWDNWYKAQVVHLEHGYGQRGFVDPNSGMLVSGPETLTDDVLAANRVDFVGQVLANPMDDDFHRGRSPDWFKITVPLLSASNWSAQGLHPRGNSEGFTQRASKQKWLEVHGLEHSTHFFTDYGRELQLRFFDYLLKGIDNGWDQQPAVQLQILHLDKFVERHENEWPLARTEWTRLYLDPARRMLQRQPAADQVKLTYRAMSDDGVTFVTPPWKRRPRSPDRWRSNSFRPRRPSMPTSLPSCGFLTRMVTRWTSRAPSTPRTPIGNGWLRATHRKLDPNLTRDYRPYHTHYEYQPLLRGQVYELDVEIWPTCLVVPAGYRIALTLLGKDFERPLGGGSHGTVLNPMRGSGPFLHNTPQDSPMEIFHIEHAVYGGGSRGSCLLLPIIPK